MKKQAIYILTTLVSFQAALSQQLSEEVVIDREITPVERKVNRPTWVSPSLLSPRLVSRPLIVNEYVEVAEITRTVMPLDPVAWADSVMRSPYRGYASVGYFPVFNVGASAGYRLVRNERMDIGAHFSYEGNSWSGYPEATSKYKRNDIGVGADGAFVFSPGVLKADLGYKFSSSDHAAYPSKPDFGSQAINIFDLSLKWTPSHSGRIGWNVGAKFGYGGFTKDKSGVIPLTNNALANSYAFAPVKDMTFGVNSDLSYNFSNKAAFVLGVALNFRNVNHLDELLPELLYNEETESEYAAVVPHEYGKKTMGVVTLSPGFRFTNNNVSGTIGVNIDVLTGGLIRNTRITPNVELQWSPTSVFAAYLRATGGEVMNSNSELWERNPWMTGVFAAERSHINVDSEIGFTIGSYKGFWGTVHAGWSSVSNWLCPVSIGDLSHWQATGKFSGFNYGIELGYAWKKYLMIKGHAEGATHHKYYRWQDNAKWAFDIAAKVRPIDKLQVELGYAVRVDRQWLTLTPVPMVSEFAMYDESYSDLGNTSNLFLGAEYEITPAFGAFVKVENLLNHDWKITENVRSQGIHGLFGVQLKF